mgnify:CR=1 FL=1
MCIRDRCQETREPIPVLVATPTALTQRGHVLVDEVVGDELGDLVGITAVEGTQVPAHHDFDGQGHGGSGEGGPSGYPGL